VWRFPNKKYANRIFAIQVKQAHADMTEVWETSTAHMSTSAKTKRKSYVMSAIAVGNVVSFSSSAKAQGKSLFYEPNKNGKIDKGIPSVLSLKAHQCPAVAQALRRCSITAPGDDKHMIHTTTANCGEEWAAYQYCLEHPNADFNGARIVAWESPLGGPVGGKIKVPCGGLGANFGCSRFVEELELDVIPMGTLPDNTRDPGSISVSYPSFCDAPST
jgi:hypothetical protein